MVMMYLVLVLVLMLVLCALGSSSSVSLIVIDIIPTRPGLMRKPLRGLPFIHSSTRGSGHRNPDTQRTLRHGRPW